ncbi:MAG: hypothetical protein U0T78_02690 [Cloacibacterium normanense]
MIKAFQVMLKTENVHCCNESYADVVVLKGNKLWGPRVENVRELMNSMGVS